MNDYDWHATDYPYATLQRPRRESFWRRLFSKDRKRLHLILFILTFFSTYIAVGSVVYSVAVMSILLAHEMGHYLMCKRYGIPATLPYFIPMPFSPFGTLAQ